jgi:AmmeMemoRadiSam system protein A
MWQLLRSSGHVEAETTNDSLPSPQPTAELSPADRATLLRVAHESIAAGADGRSYSPGQAEGVLSEPRGVFTTLYRRGQLRGCVGYVSAVRPLVNAVAETAQAAAFEDTRFAPVEREEVAEIQVSLSVLSPTFPISPEQIQIGRHGLMIRQHGHRGLLLPQVATEHNWGVETFLEQTCFKAGLPGDAWKHGAEIEAFTAEVFSDEGLHE